MQDTHSATPLANSSIERRTMVDCQIRTFDVTDRALIERLLDVPRELFLPPDLAGLAYSDAGLRLRPDSPGQAVRVLLPPLVLARLIQGASVGRADTVLDIASGGGYSVAVLAGLAGEVVGLEADAASSARMRAALEAFGLTNVRTRSGPLEDGAPDAAPFDVILINGAVEADLDALFRQLKPRGRLVTIHCAADEYGRRAAKAVRFERIGTEVSRRVLFDATVPVLDAFRRKPGFVF